ncbi:MAG: endonuclease/exonuclease/phosphatase family protein [Aureispira sp.]
MLAWLKNAAYRLLFGANILMSLLLLGAYLAVWIPPSQFYWPSVLAVGYPFLFFIHLLFAFFWIYKRKRYVYLPILMLGLGWAHFLNFFAYKGLSATTPAAKNLRVMSYNVHYFNVGGQQAKKDQARILSNIEEQAIDVFCGQEFSSKTKENNQQINQQMQQRLPYHSKGGGSSLAIFSKFPILKQGTIDFPNSYNGAIYADLQSPQGTVRVYCFHLQSIGLGNDESELLDRENLSTLGQSTTQKTYQRINNKLKHAFLQREKQVNFISQHIRESPYPVIVCGDMNDTPSSYAYGQLSNHLQDAFRQRGVGFGSTYAGILPLLRIDYIFTSSKAVIERFEVLPYRVSDHYPIYAQLSF